MQKNIHIFMQEIRELINQKEKALHAAGEEAQKMLLKSDDYLSCNQEQWESYQEKIDSIHKRMELLIHDMLILSSVLNLIIEKSENS